MTDAYTAEELQARRKPLFRFLIFFIVLLAVAAAFVFSDPERLGGWFLAFTDKRNAAVVQKPAEAAPEKAREAVGRYFQVARLFTGTHAALDSLNRIGSVAMARGEYELARQVYEPVCTRYSQYRDECQMSQILIGRSYEAQKQWDKAEQAYLGLERFYLWSPTWIEAPLYPAQMYERHGMPDKAKEAYRRAKATSLKRIKATKDPDVVTLLAWQLIKIYQGLDNWQGAQQQLRNIIDSGLLRPEKKPDFIFELASVLERHFRYGEARLFLMKFVEEFPDSPKVPEARRILGTISNETR